MKTQQKYYYDGFVVYLSLMGEHKKGSAFVEGITWLSLARKVVTENLTLRVQADNCYNRIEGVFSLPRLILSQVEQSFKRLCRLTLSCDKIYLLFIKIESLNISAEATWQFLIKPSINFEN